MPQFLDKRGRAGLEADLMQRIQSGLLGPGEKLVSTRQLAIDYGISLVTAHQATRKLVEMGLLERRPGSGTYVKDIGVQRVRRVGLVIPTSGHLWGDFSATMVELLQSKGITTVPIGTSMLKGEWRLSEVQALSVLLDQHPEAIVFRNGHPEASWLLDARRKCDHWISIDAQDVSGLPVDCVSPDFELGAAMTVRHLAKLGHRRIGLLMPQMPSDGDVDGTLSKGFEAAIAEHGIDEASRVYQIPSGAGGRDAYIKYIKSILSKRDHPTAMFTYQDSRAVELVLAARELGMKVPEDVAIVGAFNTPWSESYGLTSIDFRYDDIARRCVDMIVAEDVASEDTGYQKRFFYEPRLVVRDSCGASATN